MSWSLAAEWQTEEYEAPNKSPVRLNIVMDAELEFSQHSQINRIISFLSIWMNV